MPTFALPHAPAVLTVDLLCERNAPLPITAGEPVAIPQLRYQA